MNHGACELSLLEPTMRVFAEQALGDEVTSCHRIRNGGNNQVHHLKTVNGKDAVLKSYFWSDSDRRNRLNSEYEFLLHAQNLGISCVPRPLARDDEKRLGLYTFVHGRAIQSAELCRTHADRALEFIRELNPPSCGHLSSLPVASEACFSFPEHIQCLHRRFERLLNLQSRSDAVLAVKEFVSKELIPCGDRVRAAIERSSDTGSVPVVCISPSDFGFHNCLVGTSGQLYFVDFEYAGRDDPAKLICDFFSQPRIPVSRSWESDFTNEFAAHLGDATLPARVARLLPLYRLKWCTIMLNEFIGSELARRQFANEDIDMTAEELNHRLEKTRSYFMDFFQERDIATS